MTITRLLAAASVALALHGAAGAQQLYRCGNTFSQTPCAPDAATVRARSDAVADAAPGPHGAELCEATVTRELQIDPGSPVQIGSTARAAAEVITYADKPTATRKYIVTLKVKPYADFPGPRAFACNVSEDERRVLRFTATR